MIAARLRSLSSRITLFTAVVAAPLAGCGGGGGGLAPAAAPGRVAGSIVVHIPASAPAGTAARRTPRYVSPSTFSAKVAIAGTPSCTQCSQPVTIEAPLYGASACITNGTSRTCTIPLNLTPGSYAGTIALYDGVLDGAGHVTGKTLSTNSSFPIVITGGQTNAVSVVVNGIPVTLAATIATPTTLLARTQIVSGVTTTAYRLIGANATGQFTLIAKDADGSAIVGPGAPTWNVTANGGGFSAALNGNVVTLTAPAVQTRQSATLTITAVSPACSDPTATCTLSALAGFAEVMAIADSGFPRITLWTIGQSTFGTLITQGLSAPFTALAFAPNGTLFVANGGNNTVTAYAPPYTAAPTVISTGVNVPSALATDANNDVIVANNVTLGSATIYPPPYTTAAPVSLATGPHPIGLAVDSGNHLWILGTAGALYRYSYPYTPGGFDAGIGQPVSNFHTPSALAVDGTGRPYVANSASNTILRFDPPYTNHAPAMTIASTAGQTISNPTALEVAADGTIFVANDHTVGMGIYSAAGAPLGIAFGFYINPIGGNSVFAADADGAMWLATSTPSGPVAFPAPYSAGTWAALGTSGFLGPAAIAISP